MGRKWALTTDRFRPMADAENDGFRERDAHSVGAGVPANTGAAGARHRVGFFAGTPAPTKIAVWLTGSNGSIAAYHEGLLSTLS